MLNFNKIIVIAFFLNSFLLSQSLLDGYGIGSTIPIKDASSMGISSSGLLPSFSKDISLKNPSTWRKLNFTYFTGTYQAEQRTIFNDILNENSNLGFAQFIIPIKSKYALGIGIHPYLNQYLLLDGSSDTEYIAFGDTLSTNHSYSSFGGAVAFNVSAGGNIFDNFDAGVSFDILFGSTRQQTVYSISDIDYYSQKRHIYSGSIAKVFFNSDILSRWKIPLSLYVGAGVPLRSISIETSNYSPFEDTNNSGEQDESDFPKLSDRADPVIENIDNVSSPFEYQLGFEYTLINNWNLLGEFSRWTDTEENAAQFSILNDQIESVDRFNIGIAKFSPDITKNSWDRIKLRAGLYSNNIALLNAKKNIKEYGVSTGLSFNFGFTKNQIDFAYSIGKRQGLEKIGDENIQRFSIGITVGDIWFVKRRSQ